MPGKHLPVITEYTVFRHDETNCKTTFFWNLFLLRVQFKGSLTHLPLGDLDEILDNQSSI